MASIYDIFKVLEINLSLCLERFVPDVRMSPDDINMPYVMSE